MSKGDYLRLQEEFAGKVTQFAAQIASLTDRVIALEGMLARIEAAAVRPAEPFNQPRQAARR